MSPPHRYPENIWELGTTRDGERSSFHSAVAIPSASSREASAAVSTPKCSPVNPLHLGVVGWRLLGRARFPRDRSKAGYSSWETTACDSGQGFAQPDVPPSPGTAFHVAFIRSSQKTSSNLRRGQPLHLTGLFLKPELTRLALKGCRD